MHPNTHHLVEERVLRIGINLASSEKTIYRYRLRQRCNLPAHKLQEILDNLQIKPIPHITRGQVYDPQQFINLLPQIQATCPGCNPKQIDNIFQEEPQAVTAKKLHTPLTTTHSPFVTDQFTW